MKFKINTATLQEMVAKAVRGASSNSNLLITQLMAIQLKGNELTLITTDNSNYLYVSHDKVAGENFYVVVPVDKFSKLISKLTCEDVTLEIAEGKDGALDKLVVHGNGKYTIELPYDEEGELIQFPDPLDNIESLDDWSSIDIKLSTIKKILATAKASLYVGKDNICYSNYYVGDRVVATDTFKICGIDIKVFDEPKLISPELMDLLDLLSDEDIKAYCKDDELIFVTDKVTVFGKKEENIEDFKIDAISSLLDEQFASSCKVAKSALVPMLERLSLFVDVMDKNSVYLTFTKDGLEVSSKQDSGSEVIPYNESNEFTDYTCAVDIDLFKAQVKACQDDYIEIMYGKENTIKLVDNNVRQVIALADDDRVEE